MLTMDDAADFVADLQLRPGYEVEIAGGLIWAKTTAPNAYRPDASPREWFWSERLDWPDLDSETTLLKRIVYVLIQLDFHEHLEFTGLVNPHRDPNAVDITAWPIQLRA